MLQDILKVNDPEKDGESKFSQSRIYLLITFIVMIGLLIGSLFISPAQAGLVVNASNTLYLMLMLFSGYSLGAKGLATLKKVKQKLKID